MYKLLALDMDGTLLKDDKTMSEKTKNSLKRASEMGIKVVLTTGRPIQGIKRYLEELGLTSDDDYVIAINGALVSRASDFSAISTSAVLTGKDIKYIYSKVKGLNTYVHAYTPTNDLVSKRSKFSDEEERRTGLKVKEVDFLSDVEDDEIILKGILEEEKDILDEAARKVPRELFEEYNIIRSTPFMLEFMNKNCGKALGLEKLIQYLGIKREEVIAFGDAENDIDMLEYAGLAVVMGNASDEIKKLAGFLTKSNEEDGVAYAVEKFIFNSK